MARGPPNARPGMAGPARHRSHWLRQGRLQGIRHRERGSCRCDLQPNPLPYPSPDGRGENSWLSGRERGKSLTPPSGRRDRRSYAPRSRRPALEDTEATPPTRPINPWALVAALLVPLIPCLVVFNVVPQFEDVFKNFGAELPWITVLMLRQPWVVVAWPLFMVWLALAWRGESRRTVPLLAASGAGSYLLFVATIASMYLPIFTLAATI